MRLHSTTESIQRGEFTWLAIAECLASTAIYICVAIHVQTFHYYMTAVALAPLALLRTDAAVRWALDRYRNTNATGHRLLIQWSHQKRHLSIEIASILFVYVVTIAWGFINRIVAVFYWACRQPVEALQEIPNNWLRQAFCVDLYAPPEIVPGEDTYVLEIAKIRGKIVRAPPEILTFRKVFLPWSIPRHLDQLGIQRLPEFSEHASDEDWGFRLLRFALTLLLFAPAFLVPLIYRMSLKATCIVYAPFVWVAGITAGSTDPLKLRLERIVSGQSEKYRRRFSSLVLIIALAKLGMHFGWIDSKQAAHYVFGSPKLVSEFLEPMPWPWWQVALVIDALGTFGLLLLADALLSRLEIKGRSHERFTAQFVALASYARATLAIAVIFYLAAMSIMHIIPRGAIPDWVLSA